MTVTSEPFPFATIVTSAGEYSHEAWKANPKAPIDCFYVYPTVSTAAVSTTTGAGPGGTAHNCQL